MGSVRGCELKGAASVGGFLRDEEGLGVEVSGQFRGLGPLGSPRFAGDPIPRQQNLLGIALRRPELRLCGSSCRAACAARGAPLPGDFTAP